VVTGVVSALVLGSLMGSIPGTAMSAAAMSLPSVSSVSPTSGSTAGGTRVTVIGTRFMHVTAVKFGTKRGTSLSVVSLTKLRVTAPPHAPGVVEVRVTTTAGTSTARTADHFKYVAPPSVSSVSPTKGRLTSGVRVTVAGARFLRVKSVVFGTTAGTSISVLSSTTLQVTAPAHAAGVVNVRVRTAYGTSPVIIADRYTYVAAPAVTSLSPPVGRAAGGDRVTVTGARFIDVTKVAFGTAAGTSIHVTSPTQLEVTAPPHTAAAVDVRVTTRYGTSAVAAGDRFTYQLLFWDPPSDVGALGDLTGVSCASPTFCVAIDDGGNWSRYDGTGWTAPASIDTAGLTGISCPLPDFCMAFDSDDNMLTYDGAGWTLASTGFSAISFPSCASSTFCGAMTGDWTMTYDGQSWALSNYAPGTDAVTGVSCVTPSTCMVVRGFGSTFWFDADSHGSPSVDLGAGGWLDGVSCASATFCLAIDQNAGRVFRFNGTGWSAAISIAGAGGLIAVSCPSSSLCVAVDAAKAFTYNGTGWSSGTPVEPAGSGDFLTGLSCVATPFCAAIDYSGDAVIGR
jgi:hypothetical protein